MKRPDEIKKGLECCAASIYRCADDCPYKEGCRSGEGGVAMKKDALALIQQLESKLNQAVEDIRLLGRTGEFNCPVCAYYNNGEGIKGECVKCLTGDGFRWRGETDEKAAD